LAMDDVSLDGFEPDVLGAGLASAIGMGADDVTVSIVDVAVRTIMTLSGSATTLSPDTQAAMVASIAAEMELASPSQVQIVAVPAATRSRRAPRQAAALQVALINSGLSVDIARHTSAALSDASSMALVVTRINSPDISGMTADPPTVAVRVSVTVRLSGGTAPDVIAAALDPANAVALGAALAFSGIMCTGLRVEAPPLLIGVPGQSPTTSLPMAPAAAVTAAAMVGVPTVALPAAALFPPPPMSPGQAPPAAVNAAGGAVPLAVAGSAAVLLIVIAAAMWLRRRRAQRLLEECRDRGKLLHMSLGEDVSSSKTSLRHSRASRSLLLEEENRLRTPRNSEVRTPRESIARAPRNSEYSHFIVAAEAEARAATDALEADTKAEPVLARARRISDMIRAEAATTLASHRLTPHSTGDGAGATPARAIGTPSFINPRRWQGSRQ
jgi:hypothetical protein